MSLEDIPELWKLYQEPEITRYCSGMKESLSQELEAFPSYRDYMYDLCDAGFWVISKRDTGEIIGRAGFEPRYLEESGETIVEMGYMIGLPYQRQGYAWEACQIVLQAAQEREISRLYCRIEEKNLASVALAIKLGFERQGELWRKDIKLH